MHRHSYKGTKFHRQRDQREALLKSLADSLVLQESIETTWPKAKAVASYTEKLITKAKKGKDSLHHRRMVISGLASLAAAHKLVDELAPKLSKRTSGYLRVERTSLRRGDTAQLAKVSFVDSFKKDEDKSVSGGEKIEGEEDKPKSESVNKEAPKVIKSADKIAQTRQPAQAPKRSGIRGNR